MIRKKKSLTAIASIFSNLKRIKLFRQGQGWSENETIYSGTTLETWSAHYLPELTKAKTSIREDLRKGTPLPPDTPGVFPTDVNVRITEIRLHMDNPKADVPALNVEFEVTEQNLISLVTYFSVAYDPSSVEEILRKQLNGQISKWIQVQSLLQGWPAKWANRFPAEKTAEENSGISANDVCHGVARQFFSETLGNTNDYDRSTEASEWLLKASYIRLADGITPEFGDYLHLPGGHSLRFILRDPQSGRWITLSAWSDWKTPYRFWWTDQDYSGPAKRTDGLPVEPRPEFLNELDVWRPRR